MFVVRGRDFDVSPYYLFDMYLTMLCMNSIHTCPIHNPVYVIQCSKLRFYYVHLPDATPKMMLPANCSCATHYINLSKVFGKSIHTPGEQVSKPMHPAAKMCTQGAGCTLNFEDCYSIYFE